MERSVGSIRTFQAINALTAAVMGYLGGLPLHDSAWRPTLFESSPRPHAKHSWPPKGGAGCC